MKIRYVLLASLVMGANSAMAWDLPFPIPIPHLNYECKLYTNGFHSPYSGNGHDERGAQLDARGNCTFWESPASCDSGQYSCRLAGVNGVPPSELEPQEE